MQTTSNKQLLEQLKTVIKKVRRRNNICLDLLEFLLNEDIVKLIHQEAEYQLYCLTRYHYSTNKEIIFISLSLIALLKYDGAFYEYVREVYVELYEEFSDPKIEGTIRSVLEPYIIEGEESLKSQSRKINVALQNAIIPVHFLPAFFDFIFDIYKYNFEYDLPEDMYEEFKFAYEGLKNNMLSSGDEIQINVTHRSYKLSETTKQVIASGLAVNSVIELSSEVVKLIDNWYWGKENDFSNPYYKKGYEDWIQKNDLKNKENERNHSKSGFRSRWEPKFQLISNNIYIVPPVHTVKAQYDYDTISILVKNGEHTLYHNEKPYIREIIGGYLIFVENVKLDDPLGKVEYYLLSGEEVIYQSHEKMNRKYLIFDSNGNEIHNNTDYSGTIVVCTSSDTKEFENYYQTDNYSLAYKKVECGDFILFDNEIFAFSSKEKPGISGKVIDHQYLKKSKDNTLMKVYSEIQGLVFDTDNENSKYEILINNKNYKISEFNYKKLKRQVSWKFIVDLDYIVPGINFISVYEIFSGTRRKIASLQFGYDPGFLLNTTKIEDHLYEIYIETVMFENPIDMEINLYDFSEDLFIFDWNNDKYSYILPLPFNLYRIKGENWQPCWRDLWIEDIKQDSILEIYGLNLDDVKIFSDHEELLQYNLEIRDCEWFKEVKVGFLNTYKEAYRYIKIAPFQNGQRKKSIYCYNQCILNKSTSICYDPMLGKLSVAPYYKGRGNIILEIKDKDGNVFFSENEIKSGKEIIINGLKSFLQYELFIYEKKKGLSIQKNKVLLKKNLIVCDSKGFCNRLFRIDRGYYDQNRQGVFRRKCLYFKNMYVYFLESKTDDIYLGLIIANKNGEKIKLSKINPVDIEICSAIIDSEVEISITNDGDGLLLDFLHHGIMNTMDDKKATDIFSYVINLNGAKKYENIKSH